MNKSLKRSLGELATFWYLLKFLDLRYGLVLPDKITFAFVINVTVCNLL